MTEPTDEGTEGATAEDVTPAPLLVHGLPAEEVRGQTVIHTDAARYKALFEALRQEGYDLCSDLCAVDHLGNDTRVLPDGIAAERFEVVVNLRNLTQTSIVRVRCQVAADDPRVPTLFRLWPGTEAMEREAYDLLGIIFDEHPDLTRILLPDEWEGHPLRKDYAIGRVPVQFKAAPATR